MLLLLDMTSEKIKCIYFKSYYFSVPVSIYVCILDNMFFVETVNTHDLLYAFQISMNAPVLHVKMVVHARMVSTITTASAPPRGLVLTVRRVRLISHLIVPSLDRLHYNITLTLSRCRL